MFRRRLQHAFAIAVLTGAGLLYVGPGLETPTPTLWLWPPSNAGKKQLSPVRLAMDRGLNSLARAARAVAGDQFDDSLAGPAALIGAPRSIAAVLTLTIPAAPTPTRPTPRLTDWRATRLNLPPPIV